MNRPLAFSSPVPEIDVGLPHPLHLYHALTRSDHYHFGLFDLIDGEAPEIRSAGGLRDVPNSVDFGKAMDQLALLPLRLIPSASRVLDVGSGMGGSAQLMADRGLDVTALEPQRDLVAYAARRATETGGPSYHAVSLEDFALDRAVDRFDVLILTEVLQHFPELERLFGACSRLLRPGGRVIIHGLALTQRAQTKAGPFYDIGSIFAAARKHCFESEHQEELTRSVRPTLSHLSRDLSARAEYFIDAFRSTHPSIKDQIHELSEQLHQLAAAMDAGDLAYYGLSLCLGPVAQHRTNGS